MSLLMKEVMIDYGSSCCCLGCDMSEIVTVEKRMNIDFIKVFEKERIGFFFGKKDFYENPLAILERINGFRYLGTNQRTPAIQARINGA